MSSPPDSASDERPADAVGAEPNDPEERALADRLVNYADAVVALAVVGASGVGVAIADPDIRESFTSAAFFIAAGNLVAAALYSALIQLCVVGSSTCARGYRQRRRLGATPVASTSLASPSSGSQPFR
ncbi:MAG: hypothetical protein AAF430_17940 [Myxococcota bacterium]